jgi:hypothetical protein
MHILEAITRMQPPSAMKGNWGGVIQIHVTRACNLACHNCTQASHLGGKSYMMSLDNFETACANLAGYPGIVGVFGGNPATHPQFDDLCDIMCRYIPKPRRGLWCNDPRGHGKKMAETFNPERSNLNVHMSQRAYGEFKRDWPESRPVGLEVDSRHSPVWVALQDMQDLDDDQRWDLISDCDINQHWSAMFGQFRGELRFWFCEIAGAQSILHQDEPDYPDTGFAVGTQPVWDKPMTYYTEQVMYHCFACGVPMRGKGTDAQEIGGVNQVSLTHQNVHRLKDDRAFNHTVTNTSQVGLGKLDSMVDYLGNSQR